MEVFFWIVDLIAPATMIIIGLVFFYKPPKKTNEIYGYRTSRSMKTSDTWKFAHYKCGQLWIKIGIALFSAIVLSKLFTPIKKKISV